MFSAVSGGRLLDERLDRSVAEHCFHFLHQLGRKLLADTRHGDRLGLLWFFFSGLGSVARSHGLGNRRFGVVGALRTDLDALAGAGSLFLRFRGSRYFGRVFALGLRCFFGWYRSVC